MRGLDQSTFNRVKWLAKETVLDAVLETCKYFLLNMAIITLI